MTEMDFSDVLLRLPGLFCVVRQASRFLQKTRGFEVLSVCGSMERKKEKWI